MDYFRPATRRWFENAFAGPTPVQQRGWERIAAGDHTLLIAPTGSGKTLAAFLYALDRLSGDAGRQMPEAGRATKPAGRAKKDAIKLASGTGNPASGIRHPASGGHPASGIRNPQSPERGVRVVYISPLKALIYDIERNLRVPLAGIGRAALGAGEQFVAPRVDVRTGDTPQEARRRFARDPGEILVTTPESRVVKHG